MPCKQGASVKRGLDRQQLDGTFKRKEDGTVLSARQLEVVALLAKGLSTKQVARHLGLSYHTVLEYCDIAKHRFAAANRTGLIAKAIEAGLLDPPRAPAIPRGSSE